MIQNYAYLHPAAKQAAIQPNKRRLILLSSLSLAFVLYVAYLFSSLSTPAAVPWQPLPTQPGPAQSDAPPVGARVDSVATVVAKALYFKSLLTTTAQLSALQQDYTTSLARKWSNLPCGSGCRNGIQFSALNATQLAAALDVIRAATGTGSDDGYAEFRQIQFADTYLKNNGGGSGYDSTIYFISFLNTPTTTGTWMLQFGGHHYAANIAYNAGKVVGGTPYFMGVEPTSFTQNNVAYTPLKAEHDSFAVMLAGLTTDQLTASKITSTTYSDCYMIPGETNGGNSTFPSKVGLRANVLNSTQKGLVYAAIKNYTSDLDDSAAAVLQSIFQAGIDSTYISWTGSGTSGSSSTFLNTNTNYVRLDGPRLWLEFICQTGVVFRSQIHYHTVLRDHSNDYGKDLSATALPLNLLSFDAIAQGKNRLLNWTSANEVKVNYFEIQRSVNPSSGFTTISKLTATNSSRNSYSYTDNETIADKVIYYRLNMVDANGRSTYSNVAAVRYNGTATGITVYPNPAKDLITLASADNLENATINILNSAGKAVMHSTNRSGRNVNMDISSLPAGSYLLQVFNSGNTTTLKFVKQK